MPTRSSASHDDVEAIDFEEIQNAVAIPTKGASVAVAACQTRSAIQAPLRSWQLLGSFRLLKTSFAIGARRLSGYSSAGRRPSAMRFQVIFPILLT